MVGRALGRAPTLDQNPLRDGADTCKRFARATIAWPEDVLHDNESLYTHACSVSGVHEILRPLGPGALRELQLHPASITPAGVSVRRRRLEWLPQRSSAQRRGRGGRCGEQGKIWATAYTANT